MSKFHLMHCIPHRTMHGLIGYREVIGTVRWGLEQLGHQVSQAVNRAEPGATNIVFGAQVLPVRVMRQMPADTIVYNFEQIRRLDPHQVRGEVRHYAQHFRVWEYSQANMPTWEKLGCADVRVVPVGYAPILTRIPRPAVQDIDALIYGLTGQGRLAAFHRLSQAGMSTVFVSGLYGAARDGLIARSKLVLNINLYRFSQIFEIVRVSYLLANRKAVVATLDPQTAIEEDILPAIRTTTMERLVDDCRHLLAHDDERARLEQAGFESISRRDIRVILEHALAPE